MKIILGILLFCSSFFVTGDWTMYPNPARDHITIKTDEGELLPYVKIYDMQGRLRDEIYIGTGQMSVEINLRLPSGKYIVYLTNVK
jgi:Secretion system C-terminal sorting domain